MEVSLKSSWHSPWLSPSAKADELLAPNLGDITHGSDLFPITSDDVGHSDDREGLLSEAMLYRMLSGQPQVAKAALRSDWVWLLAPDCLS